MKLLKLLFLFAVLSGFCSCEKAEVPYKLPPRPNDSLTLMQLDLGENYEDQVFINFLDSDFVRARVKNHSWDLAFECNPDARRIFINGGKGVFIAAAGKDNFLTKVEISKLKWRWDAASGGDSIVLHNWCNPATGHSFDSVYVIDRGSETDPSKRYYQFRLENDGPGKCIIRTATTKGVPMYSTEITFDPSKNQVYYDFESGQQLNFEPPSFDWQFCFLRTRWIYYEFNPPLFYTVTGIHINQRKVAVAIDSTLQFDRISLSDATRMTYLNTRDALGFEWKVYDFTQGKYLTRKQVNYLFRMRTSPGGDYRYYKLRFTDYYNRLGVKGSPRFEVAEVKR